MATVTLSFEAILAGECGPTEAEAAKRWLDGGAPLYEPPSGLVYQEQGYDHLDMTTIHRAHGGQRRRRTSGHGQLLASSSPAGSEWSRGCIDVLAAQQLQGWTLRHVGKCIDLC